MAYNRKVKYLIFFAIVLHLAAKFFWDADLNETVKDKFDNSLNVEQQIYYTDYVHEYSRAFNTYSTSLAVVLFTWALLLRNELKGNWRVILTWWMFWLGNEVLKEVSNMTGFLSWFFLSPTEKYLSEYIVFAISTGYLVWRVQFKKKAPHWFSGERRG